MDAVKVGSLRNPADCRQAAQLMRLDRPVGVLGRSVASIWVAPMNGMCPAWSVKPGATPPACCEDGNVGVYWSCRDCEACWPGQL
jgi:hypothetical protein